MRRGTFQWDWATALPNDAPAAHRVEKCNATLGCWTGGTGCSSGDAGRRWSVDCGRRRASFQFRQSDSVLAIMNQCPDLGTLLAQPIMLSATRTAADLRLDQVFRTQSVFGFENKKFALTKAKKWL